MNLIFGIWLILQTAMAGLPPSKVQPLMPRKNSMYLEQGVFLGGDSSVKDFSVKEVRCGRQKAFERCVVELKPGESLPYVHLGLTRGAKEAILHFRSRSVDMPTLLSKSALLSQLKKTHIVGKLEYLDVEGADPEAVQIRIELHHKAGVEAFLLSNPTRLVLDFSAADSKAISESYPAVDPE